MVMNKIAGEQGNDCNIRYLGATTRTRYMKSKSLGPDDNTQTKIKGTIIRKIASITVMSDGSDDHDEACYDP